MFRRLSPEAAAPALMRWRSRLRWHMLQRLGYRRANLALGGSRLSALVRGAPAEGPGATWVFVHGFADEATGWTPLLRALAAEVGPQVVIDLPGHGLSPEPPGGLLLDEMMGLLLQSVGQLVGPRQPVVLVGNSMGGVGAMRLAQMFGARALGQVLISPAGAPMDAAELADITELFTLDSAAKARAFVRRLSPMHPILSALYARAARAHLSAPSLVALLRTFSAARWLTADELAQMPPTLLIWGQRDSLLPARGRRFLCAHLPASRTQVQMPPAWGHIPHVEHSAATAAMVLAWARQLPGTLLPRASLRQARGLAGWPSHGSHSP